MTGGGHLAYWTTPPALSSKWSTDGYSEVGHVVLLEDVASVSYYGVTTHWNVSTWSHAANVSLSGAVLWDTSISYTFGCIVNFGQGHPDGGDSYVDSSCPGTRMRRVSRGTC